MFSLYRIAAVALFWAGLVSAQKLRQEYPWYLTGDEIHSQLLSLSSNCPGVQFEMSSRSASTDVQLDVIHVSQGSTDGKKKAFFVFGEHARELISPETALVLLKNLCGQGDSMNADLVSKVLGSWSFVILPNGNPKSRVKVEAGEYCKRTNEDGVDLNRNFGDDHRNAQLAGKDDEMNPGPNGFSEPESQIVKDLVLEEKPDIFLSIHSGAYLLGTPWGYTPNKKVENEQQMMEVLKPISEKFCNGDCPYGDLAGMIGYKSEGCDIDWVKETLDTPFVFTWEIYVGSDIRKQYIEEAHSRSEGRSMGEEAKDFFWTNGQGALLQTKRQKRRLRGHLELKMPESEENPADCFNQFNPESQEETEAVTENWARAFLTLCDEVATLGKASNGTKAQATAASPADSQLPPSPSEAVPSFSDLAMQGSNATVPAKDDALKWFVTAPDAAAAPAPAASNRTKLMSVLDSWREMDKTWSTPSTDSNGDKMIKFSDFKFSPA